MGGMYVCLSVYLYISEFVGLSTTQNSSKSQKKRKNGKNWALQTIPFSNVVSIFNFLFPITFFSNYIVGSKGLMFV